MAGFALAAGGDGPAPVRRSAPGGRVARGFAAGGDGVGAVARSGCPGHLGGVPGLLRGDAPGQALVGALGVAGCGRSGRPVSRGLGDGVGQGLLVQVAEQGLVEALVVAPGWWACRVCRRGVRRPGSARAPAGRPVTPRRLGPGAAPLSAARAPGARPGRLRPCRRRRWPPDRPSPGATSQATARRQWSSWSRPGHRPCARRPGRTRRHPGPPAGVGGGAGRTGATPPSVSWTVRPRPAPSRPVDPGRPRRRGRLEAHGGHLVVHADRTVVQSRALQSRAHIEGPGANPIGQAARAGIADGATGARAPPRAPPPARAGARRRTSCARCPARRQTSSPPHGARHRATGRSPDGHGDQHCGTYRSSPLNPKPRVSPPGPAEPSPMS